MTLSNQNNSSSPKNSGGLKNSASLSSSRTSAPGSNGVGVGNFVGSKPKKKAAPPTPKELLAIYDELNKKIRAYLKNTPIGSDGDEELQKAPDDSFSSETLKKLRDLSASKTAAPVVAVAAPQEPESLKTALISAQHLKYVPEPELPSGAELLEKEVNIEDILRGVSSERQLDKTQVILNETAARQRIDLSGSVDKNASWARQTLKQEALPYTLRSAAKKKEEEEEKNQTYIPKVAPRKVFSKPSAFTPLASTPLQNPNAAPQLQASSSKLIMNQLTKSPFREVSRKEARAQAQEEHKSVFASTFTPKAGQIPIIPSINNDSSNSAEAASEPKEENSATATPNGAADQSAAVDNSTSNFTSAAVPKPSTLPPLIGKPILPPGASPLINTSGSAPSVPAFRQSNMPFALNSQPQKKAAASSNTNYRQDSIPVDSSVPMAKIRLELALNFGGRPANSRLPVFSPILDSLFQPKVKRQIARSSTPIKMVSDSSSAPSSSLIGGKALSSSPFGTLAGKVNRASMLKLSQACDYYGSDSEEENILNEADSKRMKALDTKYPLRFSSAHVPLPEYLSVIDTGWTGRFLLGLKAPLHMEGMRTKYIPASSRRYGASNAAERPIVSDLFRQLCASQTGIHNAEEEAINGAILMVRLGGRAAYDHFVRTAELGAKIAAEMKIDDIRTRRQIEYGSMFKDIGELDMLLQQESADKQNELHAYLASDEYMQALQDKGARRLRWPEWLLQTIRHLETEEYDLLKDHPRYSEEIINSVPSLRALCPVVRAHHERWDGRGGPDSLTGDRIPIAARIIAVCDAFEALTQRRPGSKTYRTHDAVEIITGGSGSAFDPQVVEAFKRVING
ncbi:MAG: HD domain-containing phosphohydrolase [Candidatus Bruticola sp.]